jgi:Zn-dependent peptidase ImmA (M78 family)/transcriptional regulator with XRE-family HTH domain
MDLAFIGNNIRQLRKWRGLTINQLAGHIGLQPVALGRTERGMHAPSASTLVGLARTFKVPESAFFAQDQINLRAYYEASLDSPFLVAEDGRKISASIQNRAVDLIECYLGLEDACGLNKAPLISFALPFDADEAGATRLAEQVREMLGIRSSIVFDYIELFELKGFRILFTKITPEESLVHYDPANRNAFFFVRDDMNPEKQIFRLLVELGRIYFLTRRMASPSQANIAVPPLEERRLTKVFASRFLMPEDTVLSTVQQLGMNPKDWSYELLLRIKHRFGVSAESFLYRLEELRLIHKKQVPELKARIYAHYEETNYEEPDSSRRILTPNGRIGDLLLIASRTPNINERVLAIRETLAGHKLRMP